MKCCKDKITKRNEKITIVWFVDSFFFFTFLSSDVKKSSYFESHLCSFPFVITYTAVVKTKTLFAFGIYKLWNNRWTCYAVLLLLYTKEEQPRQGNKWDKLKHLENRRMKMDMREWVQWFLIPSRRIINECLP